MPQRPANVPETALWIEDENEWQTGTRTVKGKLVGDCRAWNSEGVKVSQYQLNDDGALDGVNERFHPDGTIASRGEWKAGNRAGRFMFQQSASATPEHYEADNSTWRYEFEAENNWDEQNKRWFDRIGNPVTSNGRSLATAFDMDQVIDQAEPQDFLEKHAAICYQAFAGKEPIIKPNRLGLRELWGTDTREFDAVFATLCEGGDFSKSVSSREFKGNAWENLIAYSDGNYDEELASIFMGAERLGSVGDSDALYLTLFMPLRPEPKRPTSIVYPASNAVYFWTHELEYLDQVVSKSADEFVYLSYVALMHQAERLSDRVSAKAWRKLIGRVNLPHGFDSGAELAFTGADQRKQVRTAFNSELDENNALRIYFWRAQWILQLLREDSARNWDDVPVTFRANFNLAWTDARFDETLAVGRVIAPTAFYLLWRAFWFKDAARLNIALAAYAEHKALLVRDLVDLLNRFEKGLKGIVGMTDVHALRARFLALDLKPNEA